MEARKPRRLSAVLGDPDAEVSARDLLELDVGVLHGGHSPVKRRPKNAEGDDPEVDPATMFRWQGAPSITNMFSANIRSKNVDYSEDSPLGRAIQTACVLKPRKQAQAVRFSPATALGQPSMT